MKHVFLHIGPHKTGSTSIQYACMRSPSELQKSGLFYMKGLFSNGNHYEIAKSVLRDDLDWIAGRNFSKSREEIFKITKSIIENNFRDTGLKKMVVSVEALSYIREQKEVDRLKCLFPTGTKIIPIFFIRDKSEWLKSYTNEFIVKQKHNKSKKRNSVLNVSEQSWINDHWRIIELMKSNFPDTILLNYQKNVIPIFSKALGLKENLPDLYLNKHNRKVKVFQIGFNKCGTTSLHNFFISNGLKSAHFQNGNLARSIYINYNAGLPLLRGIDHFDCYTDMENAELNIFGHRYFRELYYEYKDSYFILNTRNKERWLISRLKHQNGRLFEIMKKNFNMSQKQTLGYWSAEWDAHHKNVLDFFKNRGNFLRYNIEDDPPSILTQFLSKDFNCEPKYWDIYNQTK